MKSKRAKKGFTLVELIVVIAIIGILAAVLIPTFSGAIESARLADDQAQLRNMNTELTISDLMGDREIDMHAAYQILVRNGEYTLAAKSSDHTFWWDRETKKLVLAETEEILTNSNFDGTASAAAFERDDIGAVAANARYVLVDQGTSALAQAVNGLRSCTDASAFATYSAQFKSAVPSSVAGIVDTMMFWSEGGSYVPDQVTAISFELGIRVLPSSPFKGFSNAGKDGTVITLPSTVGLIKEGAFTSVGSSATLTVTAPKITVAESGSFPKGPGITMNGVETVDLEVDLTDRTLTYRQDFTQMEVYYQIGDIVRSAVVSYDGKTSPDYASVTNGGTFLRATAIFNFTYENNGQGAELILSSAPIGKLVTYTGVVYKADGSLYGAVQNVGYFTSIEISEDGKTITLPFTSEQLLNYGDVTKLTAKAGGKTVSAQSDPSAGITFSFDEAPTGGTYQIFYGENLIFEQEHSRFEQEA